MGNEHTVEVSWVRCTKVSEVGGGGSRLRFGHPVMGRGGGGDGSLEILPVRMEIHDGAG